MGRPVAIVGDPNDDEFFGHLSRRLDAWKEESRRLGMFHDWIDLWDVDDDGIRRRNGVVSVAVDLDSATIYFHHEGAERMDQECVERWLGLFQRAYAALRSNATDV